MAVTTQMRTQVAQLYVSLFGRAPEADGLGYWVAQLGEGKSFQAIAQDMFNVAPARAYYPSFLTNEEIVAKFYINVLGRAADAGGLAYWTGRLNTETTTGTAASKAIAQGTVITEMLTAVVAYSGTDAAALQSQSLLNNKVAVALHYAVDLGGNDIAFASTLLPLVTAGATGTTAANAAADASFNQTKTLTISATDVIVGGNANDTIIGQTGQTTTLQASDKIDGASGTDTLRIVTDKDAVTTTTATGVVQGFTVTNVEVLEVQAQDVDGTVLGLENVDASLKTIRSSSTNANLTVKNVNNIVDVEITKNLSSANVAIQYTAAAVAGTADTQKVALNGNTTGTLKFGSNTDALSGAGNTGIETIAFTSTGAASTVGGVDSTAKTITVAGDKNLTLGGLNAAVNKVDAGTFTGKLGLTAAAASTNVTVIGGTASDTLDMSANTGKSNITAGDGDDVITMGANLTGDDSIDGGNGSDTIVVGTIANANVNGGGSTAAKSFANVKSVESLTFNTTTNGSLDATVQKVNTAGVMTYNFTPTSGNALNGATTLAKTSDAVTVNLNAQANGNNLSVTQAVATGATATGSVNVVAQVDSTNNYIGTLTTTGNAVLNLTANDNNKVATTTTQYLEVGSIADADLTTLNVKGNAHVYIDSDLSGNENLATITSTTTGDFYVVDTLASDDVPGLTVSAVGMSNYITTGAGNDVINAGGSDDIEVYAGNGNNTVTAAGSEDYTTSIVTGSGADKITVTGDGYNEIHTGNGNDVVTVTGAGDSDVTVGTGIFNVSFATGTNTVYADAAQFTSTDSVTGGDGWDTIQLTGGSIVALTDGYFNNVSAVEQLNLNNNSSVTVNQIANAHGLQQINVGNGAVTVGEGFTKALTVEMTGGTVTVTGNAIAGGDLTVVGDVSDLDGYDTITGGKSTSDKLVLTADNGAGTLSGVTAIESVTLVNGVDGDGELVDDSAYLSVGATQAKALTIDASAMIGDLTVDAAGQTKVMTIKGSAGANTITGGNASDVIVGGESADSIEGGLGSDALTGGTGADKFVYRTLAASSTSSYDTISDFQAAKFASDGVTRVVVDKIQVNNDASVMTNGPATVTFKGSAAGFGNAQALLLNNDSTHGAVIDTTTNSLWIDLNNDGTLNGNDLRIDLTGVTTTGTLKFATDNIQVLDLTAPTAVTLALASDTGSSSSDNNTQTGTVNVTGLEAGATWEYNAGAGWVAGTGTSFNLGTDGAKSVTVRQFDGTNYSTTTNIGYTVDTAMPAAATIALAVDTGVSGDLITSNGNINITGLETTAGTTTTYSINSVAQGALATSGSTAALNLTGLADNTAHTVVVTQTDLAGNVRNTSFTFNLDKSAATPTLALTTDSFGVGTTGTSADLLTNVNTVTASGIEVGAKVEYSYNGGTSWTVATMNAVGGTQVIPGSATDGAKQVMVKQTDVSGNVSTNSLNLAYNFDSTIVAPTVALAVDTLTAAGPYGTNSDLNTSNPVIVVSGLETGAAWSYTVNGGGAIAGTGNSFNATAGTNVYAVTTIDKAGNVSAVTTTASITYDATAPSVTAATITAISADTFETAATYGTNADFITKTAAQTVSGTYTGTVAAGETIQVSLDGGTTWVNSTTAAANNWTLTGATLNASGTITVRAVDLAGNVTANFGSQAYTLDTAAPTQTVTAITMTADTFDSLAATGTAIGNATDGVTVTAAQDLTATLSAALGTNEIVEFSNDGTTWVQANSGGNTLTGVTLVGSQTWHARVVDIAGNLGAETTKATVLDTTAPLATSTTVVLSADTGSSATDLITKTAAQTVSGVLDAALATGETVQVKIGAGAWTYATSATGTAWSLSGVTLAGTQEVQVRVLDKAGNYSADITPGVVNAVLDTTAPTILSLDAPVIGDSAVTVVFSESVTINDLVQFHLWNTTDATEVLILSAAGAGDTWTFTTGAAIAAKDYDVTVGANGFTDLAGNLNTVVLIGDAPLPQTAVV